VHIPGPLLPATFIRRDNRFRATVELNREPVAVHVPNSGRLHELFVPGRKVLIRPVDKPHRKTRYDLVMVWADGVLVSLDSRLPGPLLAEAVRAGRLAEFAGYHTVREEVPLGHSRIDVLLEGEPGQCWIEAKSVTLVEEGTAYFPDAVTARGKRHVEELAAALEQGVCAAIIFVVQREDAERFRPHDASDPAFGRALRLAAEQGVKVRAYRCRVQPDEIQIDREIPVILDEE